MFAVLPELKKKRKKQKDKVPLCRHFLKGECEFGNTNCWFNHDKDEIDTQKIEDTEKGLREHKDLSQKQVEIIEKFTEYASSNKNN